MKCKQCYQKTDNPKFCGNSCAAKYNNSKFPKRKPENKCRKCKNLITTRWIYCKDCTPRIDLATMTLGDLPGDCYIVNAKLRRHARQVYHNSGRPMICTADRCRYDKHVHIAHIKAIADFSQDTLLSDINNLDNLTALCPNHHWEYDNL